MFSELLTNAASRMGFFFCKYRGNKYVEAINKLVFTFHRELNNKNFNMETNGETRALGIISTINPECVFDVGANVGQWTQSVRRIHPTAVIHAFEIVPPTYKKLAKNTKDLSNIVLNNSGLSNEKGKIKINIGKHSTSSSAFRIEGMKFHDNYYKDEIECQTIRGIDYLKDKGIEKVDLLKIDTEGMDLRVIKGFEEQLEKVRIIQFEYGIFNIASHDLLGDFFHYLRNRGFLVGKIFPRHVSFFNYGWRMENFYGANFLAVRKTDKELIEALRGS